MFLHRPHRDSGGTLIQTIRDIVEIVAITLAGVWALYIFVYENRIKPAIAPPDLVFSGEMERVSTHDNFAVVRVLTHIKNVGSTTAQFLGYSITILGSRFVPAASKTSPNVPNLQILRPFYSFSGPIVVYRRAFLTHATNPSFGSDLRLGPNESSDEDTIVYAPLDKFDHLSLQIVSAYIKETNHPIPTSLSYGPTGIPKFSVDANAAGQELYGVNAEVAALDLSNH